MHTLSDYLQVSQILVNNGQACGVQVKKGNGVVNVTAPIIISDAGMLEQFIHELLTRTVLYCHFVLDILNSICFSIILAVWRCLTSC